MHKRGQSGGFLGRPSGLLQKTGLLLMENVLKPFTKSILIPLGLTAAAAAAATDAAIHKKMFGSGNTTLIVSTFEIQTYYQSKPEFNYVYSRNNLPKKMIALYVNGNNRKASYDAIYFDSFGVEYIPKEI